MNKYFYVLAIVAFISCNNTNKPSLEINFTTSNPDTFRVIKSFYLTSLTQLNQQIGFKNVTCAEPNKFVFNPVKEGLYIGLLTIENNDRIFYVTIDSINIRNGKNIITKEMNLGRVTIK